MNVPRCLPPTPSPPGPLTLPPFAFRCSERESEPGGQGKRRRLLLAVRMIRPVVGRTCLLFHCLYSVLKGSRYGAGGVLGAGTA